MGRKNVIGMTLCGLAATLLMPGTANAQADRVCSSEKGSLLIYSKVELRYDSAGNLTQDTFIHLTNDSTEVDVLAYFVNGDAAHSFGLDVNGDGMVDADDDASDASDSGNSCDRPHPGWNNADRGFTLTSNQPICWSASTGVIAGSPPGTLGGLSFETLDPGPLPGRPEDPANCIDGDRILRGFIVLWAVSDIDGAEITHNHLSGHATIVNYEGDYAWEYPAWAFGRIGGGVGDGVLNMDGVEYVLAYDLLLLNYYADGSSALSGAETVISSLDLTLHPIDADLRQDDDGPVTTKAHFDVWNQNELKLSGLRRCITCWDQTLAEDYVDFNNYLTLAGLGTDCGKARIDGQASNECDVDFDPNNNADFPFPPGAGDPVDDRDIISVDAAILGVRAHFLDHTADGEFDSAAGGALVGMGTEAATILYDPIDNTPPTDTTPDRPAASSGKGASMASDLMGMLSR